MSELSDWSGRLSAPLLSLRNVTLSYGDTVALSAVNLDVGAGKVVAVIGPSGCGKSSLLRAVAGLEPLTNGRIELDGQSLEGVATHERGLGLMFQDHALFPHLSVGDNVAFGLRMQHQPTEQRQQRVGELLDLVGLAGLQSRAVHSLSGGEAQRVALARALAPSPRLLMLDEPLGSLDRVLREQLASELRRLFTELGVTALHVTHDQAEAFTMADHIVVLRNGQIEQQGAPAELWHSPTSVFVAQFLGHPNIWKDTSGHVLAPITAVRVDPNGPIEAQVEQVEFREGRFRVTARELVVVEARRLVFDHNSALAVGDVVRLFVDKAQLAALAD